MILSEDDIEHYHPITLEKFSASIHIRREILIERRGVVHLSDFDAVSLPTLGALAIEERWLQANDVAKKVILFVPHNFPEVHHLNLAESYFFRYKEERDESLCVRDPLYYKKELHTEFKKACTINILNALLNHITCNPINVDRFVKSFLGHARMSRCIQNKEKIPITRLCLKALSQQNKIWQNRHVVVEVLRTFCLSHFHKEDLVIGDYLPQCLEYVIKSCIAAKFNIRLYLMHDDRGRAIPFCPITSCILSGQHNNFAKLKVLLEHGFELQAINSNINQLTYIIAKMNQQLGINVIGSISPDTTSDRRYYLLLVFLYTVRRSFGSQTQWIQYSNILFNSITDTYIHHKELRCLLTKIYRNDLIEGMERRCKTFTGFVPASVPRKLKHLCRCVIRMALRENFELPLGIYELPLPKSIIQYLINLDY